MAVRDIAMAEVLVAQHERSDLAASSDFGQAASLPILHKSGFAAPAIAWPLTFAGRALLRQGFPRLALRLANAALRVAPDSLSANLLAAKVRQRRGDLGRALAHLRAAAARDGRAKRAHWELAKLLQRLGREGVVPEAISDELVGALDEASRSSEGAIRLAARVALSSALYERGDYQAALTAADAAVAAAPDDVRAIRARANALVPHNRIAESRGLFERLLAKNPTNGEIARKVELLGRLAADLSRPRPPGTPAPREELPLLIGIGAGIGDILHATPMIRNAARHSGGPVDVLVLADHPGAEFLIDNPAFVRRVWTLGAAVLEERYRTVFLAHSFGPLRFGFNAQQVCTAASWQRFRPGRLHETLFNLEAAKHLLGFSYEAADAGAYFVNTLRYQPTGAPLVGIHAGSKSGRWLSKRWPYFAGLAARLKQRGIVVASFGTPDEYVEGTEDRTGGTVEEMCRAMLECSHFVSNDSGPMHIASALGIPVLALFAPTDAISRLPLTTAAHGVALAKDCSPCEVRNHGHFSSGRCHCIGEISVEEVETRLLKRMAADNAPKVRANRESAAP
jgi:tetratricopeptide (TPR) repeat protein